MDKQTKMEILNYILGDMDVWEDAIKDNLNLNSLSYEELDFNLSASFTEKLIDFIKFDVKVRVEPRIEIEKPKLEREFNEETGKIPIFNGKYTRQYIDWLRNKI